MTIDPKAIPAAELYRYLSTAVAPRPIALASTIDGEGRVNLSPFSYFNVFSTTPPILIFSPINRGRDGSRKDTLNNVREVPEVAINIGNFAMVEQMSLASSAYPPGINEFGKAGLSETPSDTIRPPRVAEAPISFECGVDRVIALGQSGGAGNLVVAEVRRIHLDDRVLDADGGIDTRKLDLVARLGGDDYLRVIPEALFSIPKPIRTCGIGVDALPDSIRNSRWLSGNQLGRLGNVEAMPAEGKLRELAGRRDVRKARSGGPETLHHLAADYLDQGKAEAALGILLLPCDL